MKITIIGAGNMGGAIAKGLAKGSLFASSDITCTAHTQQTLDSLHNANSDLRLTLDNVEAVANADIVVIAVKPWLVESIIEEIRPSLRLDKQIFVSIAAGLSFETLHSWLLKGAEHSTANPAIFRVIPNTAIEVGSSMTFVAAYHATAEQIDFILRTFNELGNAMLIKEELMQAGTALASCGIAFAFRYIRAAIEGGVELGFYPAQAQEIVAHTLKGAVDLLLHNGSHPEMEIDKVTTPGGITIKGINELEHAGFTSAVIRGLKACK